MDGYGRHLPLAIACSCICLSFMSMNRNDPLTFYSFSFITENIYLFEIVASPVLLYLNNHTQWGKLLCFYLLYVYWICFFSLSLSLYM